jgi:hypothetical protein
MRRARRTTVTFRPGDLLVPCPFCGWVGDGMVEGELWRHLAHYHDAATNVARAHAEMQESAERRKR